MFPKRTIVWMTVECCDRKAPFCPKTDTISHATTSKQPCAWDFLHVLQHVA